MQTVVQSALALLQHRCTTLVLKVNPSKSKYMVFGLPPPDRPLRLGDAELEHAGTHQYPEVWLDPNLTFRTQVHYLLERMQARTKVLQILSRNCLGAPMKIKKHFYIAAIRPVLDYCAPCLPGISQQLTNYLDVPQN